MKQENNIISTIAGRYFLLVRQLFVTLLACMFCTYVSFDERNAQAVWGDSHVRQLIGALSNAFGIPDIVGAGWYVGGWRIIGLIVVSFVVLCIIDVIFLKNRVYSGVKTYMSTHKLINRLFVLFIPTYMLQAYVYSYYIADSDVFNSVIIGRCIAVLIALPAAALLYAICNIDKSNTIDRIWQSKYGVFIFSVSMVLVSYLIAILTSEMGYVNVDDGSIQYTLAGYSVGEPFAVHQYINVILSYCISSLYRVFPGVQWWYVYSQLVVFVGMLLIHIAIFRCARAKELKIGIPAGIAAMIDIGLIVYTISNISFTTVPAVLGTGIAAMLFTQKGLGRKGTIILNMLVVLGFAVMYMHRNSVGVVFACYILMAYLFYLVRKDGFGNIVKNIVDFLILSGLMAVMFLLLRSINTSVQLGYQDEEFVRFNSARIAYMDYQHDSYEDNPELYEKAGWDKNIYELANALCFIPDEINADSFNYITDNSNKKTLSSEDVQENVLEVPRGRVTLIIFVAGVLVSVLFVLISRDKTMLLFLLFNNVGSIILMLYQLYIGRILYRTIYIIILPAVVINLILVIMSYDRKRNINIMLKYLITIIVVVISVGVLEYNFDGARNERVRGYRHNETEVNNYVMEHSDNTYVCTVKSVRKMGPWNVYRTQKPYNILLWGGSTYYSPHFKEQLKANKLDRLSGESFKQDNVYFMISIKARHGMKVKEDSVFISFYNYLKEYHDAIGFSLEDTVTDSVYVYHFVYKENAEQYDEFFDVQGDRIVSIAAD